MSALYAKTVTRIAAGAAHNLALCSDGTVAAWGDNLWGALGDGSTESRLVPVEVSREMSASALDGKTVIAITAGRQHSVALCDDGTIASWGRNSRGQLGNAIGSPRQLPSRVDMEALLPGERFVRVFSGQASDHVLAVAGVRQTAPRVHTIRRSADGTVSFTVDGRPLLPYEIQRSDFVWGPWTTVAIRSTQIDGVFTYSEISFAPQAFYRLVW